MVTQLASWTQANETDPAFCQKVYEGPNYFKTHLHHKVVRSFFEWSCQIGRLITSKSLFAYAKDWKMAVLEYTVSGGFDNQRWT